MERIEVTDAGPIEGTFAIDLSPGPGAYELRGARGTGKTTVISSLDWLAGHKVDVTLHDGAVSGKIEGLGVLAPIGSRKRRKGDLDLDVIDAEKFSLTDLVDPPGKTPEVRDATAIKALAVLSGAKADPTLYYDLAGGQAEFDALGVALTDDPVLLATRVKQAYDKQARERQNTADAEVGHAAPLEVVPDGLDMSQSSDLEALGKARDEARDKHKTLVDGRVAGMEKEKEVAQAKERLGWARSGYEGPTVKAAEKAVKDTADAAEEAHQKLEAILVQLAEAKEALTAAEHAAQLADARLVTAAQHEATVAALSDTASQEVAYPTPEEITSAFAAVVAASDAYDRGIRIRDAKQNQAKAKLHREAADLATKEAADAHNRATQVFDILAQSLHTTHLEIRSVDGAPRLFVQHPKRGRTAFDRVNGLSDGERVDMVLRELLPHLGSPGLLPIPQRVWQDLQPTDRQNLHALAAEKGLFLFGAQVSEGPLHVAYLGGDA